MIEFNESLDKEFSSINMYAVEGTWKSEFTKKKADKKLRNLFGVLVFLKLALLSQIAIK